MARIGVTGNSRWLTPSWWCISLSLRLVGAIPLRISVNHDKVTLDDVDGLIVSGGDDISPDLYQGESSAHGRHDAARDALEIDWIKGALEKSLPILGICRGAQLINVVLGGSLHPDLRQLRVNTYNRPGLLPTKQVVLERESFISRVVGSHRHRVNSLHHQAIKEPGEGMRIVGTDRDGIAQAVEHHGQPPILGVQWHPEYLFYLPSSMRLFRWIANASR